MGAKTVDLEKMKEEIELLQGEKGNARFRERITIYFEKAIARKVDQWFLVWKGGR